MTEQAMDEDTLITVRHLLAWLEEYSHVLDYSAERRRAYLCDEDGDEPREAVPVALVRRLIADGSISVWRAIGQWNRGYDTYKPTWWVNEWNAQHPKKVAV